MILDRSIWMSVIDVRLERAPDSINVILCRVTSMIAESETTARQGPLGLYVQCFVLFGRQTIVRIDHGDGLLAGVGAIRASFFCNRP